MSTKNAENALLSFYSGSFWIPFINPVLDLGSALYSWPWQLPSTSGTLAELESNLTSCQTWIPIGLLPFDIKLQLFKLHIYNYIIWFIYLRHWKLIRKGQKQDKLDLKCFEKYPNLSAHLYTTSSTSETENKLNHIWNALQLPSDVGIIWIALRWTKSPTILGSE